MTTPDTQAEPQEARADRTRTGGWKVWSCGGRCWISKESVRFRICADCGQPVRQITLWENPPR